MDVQPKMKWTILLLWIFIVPAGIWLTYHHYPPIYSHNQIDIIGFLLLSVITASMPIVINKITLFFIQWVAFAIFLIFGLFVEIMVMQIAIICLLLRLRIQKKDWFRLPLNSLMFFLVSFISGWVYYVSGGTHIFSQISNFSAIGRLFLYEFAYFGINQLLLTIILLIIYDVKRNFFSKDFLWETSTTIFMFPFGIMLYFLYQQVGIFALFFVGIPFISISVVINLYHSSEKVNKYLQNASEIGHQLAERLQVQQVIDLFITKITELIPVDSAYILDVVGDELQVIRKNEHASVHSKEIRHLKKNEGIAGYVWDKQKSYLFSQKKEWKHITKGYLPDETESIIAVPIVRHNRVVGILVLTSMRKRVYEKSQLMIVDILCSYFAAAIENARHYEETKQKSEQCALTKLYNYRYFENILQEEFQLLSSGNRKMLSLMLLDIDHFKAVNDSYGHQSGNDILCELATRLQQLIRKKGIVARYGGEEFVILLPNMNKAEALEFAELVRQTIANRPFLLYNDLAKERHQIKVHITASIGVASAPEDAEDALSFIRHADRAMYIGAKQAGRNKVAGYAK